MKKKYKRVFSINNDLGLRNYTVRDIIKLKGKQKLTQVRVTTVEEAAAAEEAGIDLLLTGPGKDFPNIRKAASKTFMTVGVPFIENPSKREATKKAFEIIEAGADSLMCQNWNLEWMAHLSKFRIPFQSHVGFIPRRTTWIGGIRSFGKTANEAAELFRDIKDIEKTGAWGIEVELVPENILEVITKHTSLVTISIGSGIACLLYTSPSPRDGLLSRMPSSA